MVDSMLVGVAGAPRDLQNIGSPPLGYPGLLCFRRLGVSLACWNDAAFWSSRPQSLAFRDVLLRLHFGFVLGFGLRVWSLLGLRRGFV